VSVADDGAEHAGPAAAALGRPALGEGVGFVEAT